LIIPSFRHAFLAILFSLGNNELVMIEFQKNGGLVILYNFGANLPGFAGLKKIAAGPSRL